MLTMTRPIAVAALVAFTVASALTAQLPPDVLVDRYLVRVERLSSEQDYEAALLTMEEIVSLQREHNLALPDEFYFVYAELAFSGASFAQAVEFANRYLAATGRTGQFYEEALNLWDRAESEVRRRAEEDRRARNAPGREFRDCAACPEMVVVPAGTHPVHETKVPLFALSKHEVTLGQYTAFVEATGRSPQRCEHITIRRRRFRFDQLNPIEVSWREPGFEQNDEHPVVCVNGEDASAYAKWLSGETAVQYRLPSAMEWEYAARAGVATTPWGDTASGACSHANGFDRSTAQDYGNPWGWDLQCSDRATYTARVGSYTPNGFGLHDMFGNVWEWVAGCWGEDYVDMSAWPSGCSRSPWILRGGSWLERPGWGGMFSAATPRLRRSTFGFRVARMLD